jgi:carboxyl-terminal processing protease
LIHGPAGSHVRLDVLDASEGYRRRELDLVRSRPTRRSYALRVERGIGVLSLSDLGDVPTSVLNGELDDVAGRGTATVLLDLRNVVDLDPRAAARVAGLFSSGTLLQLRNRSDKIVETIEVPEDGSRKVWTGSVAALVNGATAGSGEALARLIQAELKGLVIGEATYGLGSEPTLLEMEDGTGLLISTALWETRSGAKWNGDGVVPDEVVHGKGGDYAARIADQLQQALTLLENRGAAAEARRKAA